jgi:hypothetical protein
MKTAKEAIACYLCIDKAELTKANYKKENFTKAIYKIGDDFFTAKMDFQQFPKRRNKNSEDEDFKWQEIPDPYVNERGWKIYRAIK